jgi:hypothetical protein
MKTVPRRVSFLACASQESSPPTVLHVYESVGVRLKLRGTLLFRSVASGLVPWSLSKTGGVPLGVAQGE